MSTAQDPVLKEHSLEYLARGITFLRDDALASAQAAFEVSYATYENAAALDGLGCVAVRRGAYEDAAEWFQKAALLSPEYTHVKGNQGTLALLRNNADRAATLLTEAMRDNPENHQFRYNKAMAMYKKPQKYSRAAVLEELYRAAIVRESKKVTDTIEELERYEER